MEVSRTFGYAEVLHRVSTPFSGILIKQQRLLEPDMHPPTAASNVQKAGKG